MVEQVYYYLAKKKIISVLFTLSVFEPRRIEFEPPRHEVIEEAQRKNKENDSFNGKMNILI